MPEPSATVIHGDAQHLPLDDCTVDAVVTDPPYDLTSGKSSTVGFMGRKWDGTGVAFDPDTWREAYRVMKPGAYLLAFGGMRTQHRLICAIEDAGFEIRDAIVWHFASGFPKSLDVGKAIDRAAGAEREVVGQKAVTRILDPETLRKDNYAVGVTARGGLIDVTAPATDDARRWQGFGTALKPASEIICVARRPLAGTVAQNVLTWGCGALNIDATRVSTEEVGKTRNDRRADEADWRFRGGSSGSGSSSAQGRWPSNVVLSHVPLLDDDGEPVGDACADGCQPQCPVAELDAQSGSRKAGGAVTGGQHYADAGYDHGIQGVRATFAGYADSGTASRFFPTFRYQAKAPTRERPKVNGVAHPTVKPLELLKFLCRLVGSQPGSLILDPFAGSGTTVEAALLEGFDAVGVEQAAEYLPLIQHRINRAQAELAACQPTAEAEPTLFDVA